MIDVSSGVSNALDGSGAVYDEIVDAVQSRGGEAAH